MLAIVKNVIVLELILQAEKNIEIGAKLMLDLGLNDLAIQNLRFIRV
jgi:hypothetical protein